MTVQDTVLPVFLPSFSAIRRKLTELFRSRPFYRPPKMAKYPPWALPMSSLANLERLLGTCQNAFQDYFERLAMLTMSRKQ